MSKPDLTAIPYELDVKAIAWVRSTIDSMSVDEKCDMILFFRNHDEDFGFVRAAVESGEISAERLEDALTRILGLKAKLGLHRRPAHDLVPPVEELELIASAEQNDIAARIADQTIALLKDTVGTLPLDPARHRRIRLYCLDNAPDFTAVAPEFKRVAVDELTAAGFEVSVYRTAQELAADGQDLDMQSFFPPRLSTTRTATTPR
jgi:beta-N-acetylhexosaminidase